jgi:hypothetical protein
MEEPKSAKPAVPFILCLAIGAGLGAALGNVAIGAAIGLAVGLLLSAVATKKPPQ